MTTLPTEVDIAVIGGGSAGLYLALLLAARGLNFVVLECQRERQRHSRAIGIHAPALEALAARAVAEDLVERGITVREGLAFGHGGYLGRLRFDHVSSDYPFVLTLPQDETESVLETHLRRERPGALVRGARVTRLRRDRAGYTLTCEQDGATRTLHARFVVGADGARSFTRDALGIAVRHVTYPDSYLMGDFDDTTVFAERAAVFLTPHGVVESFPLPQGLRRWVVKTPRRVHGASPGDLTRLVQQRTRLYVPPDTCRMLSTFTAERRLARRFVHGHAVLIGDAAHVVSPIGGQGMNLAWLDAVALTDALGAVLQRGAEPSRALHRYAATRQRAARRAARIAEVNMALGRAHALPVRDALVRALLHPPLAAHLARVYAMRWAAR